MPSLDASVMIWGGVLVLYKSLYALRGSRGAGQRLLMLSINLSLSEKLEIEGNGESFYFSVIL